MLRAMRMLWVRRPRLKPCPGYHPDVLARAAILAHPLLDPGGLRVPPLSTAVAAMLLVTAVARFWPGGHALPGLRSHNETHSWLGPLRGPMIAGRLVGILLLVLAVTAGRLGSERELENIAPALIIGAAWPLLLLGSALVGAVWRWLDPWDALARPVAPPGEASGDVHWAGVAALAWVWYLSAYQTPLHPRSIGLALGAYTIVTLAGCLALGRRKWLSRAEAFGLLFGWTALLRRGHLPSWAPPRGAEIVLGVLAGGLAFGAIRQSSLWGGLNLAEHALVLATAGIAVAAGGFAALLWWIERWAGAVEARGSVAAAMVPAVLGLAIALALARNRLFTSVQLLPGLLADPLGSGGGPLARGYPLEPDPLGVTGLVLAQAAVLLAAHVAGALILARRAAAPGRQPAMVALAVSVGVGMAGLTAAQV